MCQNCVIASLLSCANRRLLRSHANARVERRRIHAGHVVDQLVRADVTTFLLRRLLKDPFVHALILLLHARVLRPLMSKFTAALQI